MSDPIPTLGWSQFAKDHSVLAKGNSYTTLDAETVIRVVRENWHLRKPGQGETTTDRKVVVPVPSQGFYCPPRSNIKMGLPVQAEVVQRQKFEDPYVEKFVWYDDAKEHDTLVLQPAKTCGVVCYSADALCENDGKRTTDCDWEIVCLLASPYDTDEPMSPLTMARNHLEKPGGTKGEYKALDYARSIWHHSTKKTLTVKARPPQ